MCFLSVYFFPEATARVVAEVGCRAMVGITALDFPTPYGQGWDEYIDKGLAVAHSDTYRDHPLIKWVHKHAM